ncbi:beta-galactosidase [Nonlabens arenilitoris]|uniref:Beta-galactosidase n=1 Tax=Nonlabens arenilitoris TaxID=1217969 RepID=A0A2S7U6F0_9FLAO|nr:glycoside hydrolase family 2 TIM barrel-domain containing protein [Nonlabens arenilitoris]PQJ30579.1 beta-galactosidase [Nonlabens arenilitoris]
MNHFLKLWVLIFVITASCDSAVSGISTTTVERSKININQDWQYLEHPTLDINEALEKQDWESVNLPHTWNALDATDLNPGYRRSSSWYKKDLEIETIADNPVYELYFEGVNIISEVYVNGTKVGGHIGGYIGFTVDITDVVKAGSNEVLVRADNSYDPEVIPSQKSDFFIYGGITRDVWLVTLPQTHIDRVKVTPTVSAENASLLINVETSTLPKEFIVDCELTSPTGKSVKMTEAVGTDKFTSLSFENIKSPELWSTKSPNLYTLTTIIKNGDKIIDQTEEKIGLRWFEFKDHGAFYLNGERLLLRGTHRHEEHAGVGAAMSNEQHRADMELIKSMGANFVRLAHYPQDPEVYKACDELGLIVWDELPWCRGGLGNDVWQENTTGMLKEIINQNYNHPSIVFWSLGNEMYWLPDFEDGDNTVKMNEYLQSLNDLAHEMDPSRVTAIRKYYEGAGIVDVFSPSIWSGWYSGSYKSYQKAIDQYKAQYKHFIHTEYGGSSHLGRHTENPVTGEGAIKADGWEEAIIQTDVANIAQIGDWSENYMVDLFDWHLRISETDSTFIGNAQWAFKDFGTPLRPENDIPYINQKGLVDRNNNPKDSFYVFKSYWSDEPFVWIESHTWTERQGPKGTQREISVYSNAPEVEFFINGQSLGTKKKDISKFPASGLTWKVDFKEGKNKLKAVGTTNKDKQVSDELEVNYRFTKNGKAKELILESEKLNNGNYLITATAMDGDGLRCLDYEERVYFQALSGGTTLKSLGTPTGSESIKMANGKASIEIVRDDSGKELEVMVLNQSFKGTYLVIE